MFFMTITILLVFGSAFFTDIIGIHPIFGELDSIALGVPLTYLVGAFVTGLIIPHEGGFAISLVQKLEDIITLLFVPVVNCLSSRRSRTANSI